MRYRWLIAIVAFAGVAFAGGWFAAGASEPVENRTPLAVAAEGGICILDPSVAARAQVSVEQSVSVTLPTLEINDHGDHKSVDRVRETVMIRTPAGREINVPVTALRPCIPVERERCTTGSGNAAGVGEDPKLVWLEIGQQVEVAVPMVYGPVYISWIVIDGQPYDWTWDGPLLDCALVKRPTGE